MSVSVKMPALGESVAEGTVTRWLKKEGEQVAVDEPLLEVSTDKVDTEIPSPAAGVLLRILAHEDETVAVGAELAIIGSANEAPLQPATQPDTPPQDATPQPPTTGGTGSAAGPQTFEAAPEPAPPSDPVPAPAATSGPAGGSATPVVLPALGESVAEGTVTRWLKAVGDQVAVDEPLLEVSTDKVDTEIPSPVAGTLLAITVAEDQVVAVGGQLGLVGAEAVGAPAPAPAERVADTETSSSLPTPAPAAPPPAAPPAASPQPAAPAAGAPAAAAADIGYVTPLVRKLAAEYRVDLAGITGTGVGGRIRKQDVLEAAKLAAQQAAQQAAEQPAPAVGPAMMTAGAVSPLRGRTEKMSRLRKVIAERMVQSLQTSAQLTTVVEVDVTRIAVLRQRAKAGFEAREGVKLSFLPFFAKAVVESLKAHPSLNASIDTDAGTVTYHEVENLGIAVDTERGLLVPVIRDSGDLTVSGLAKRIADVAERTRTGKISPDELADGTFTLTNTGSRGALFDTPIINQPQVAVLGTGAVVKRPVVVTDETGADSIAIRSLVFLALTYDHRLVDGADAARFLGTVKARLEEGAFDGDL